MGTKQSWKLWVVFVLIGFLGLYVYLAEVTFQPFLLSQAGVSYRQIILFIFLKIHAQIFLAAFAASLFLLDVCLLFCVL